MTHLTNREFRSLLNAYKIVLPGEDSGLYGNMLETAYAGLWMEVAELRRTKADPHMTYTIRPSDVYHDKARAEDALRGWQVIAFRPVKKGERYLPNYGAVIGPTAIDLDDDIPRFIVEPLPPSGNFKEVWS